MIRDELQDLVMDESTRKTATDWLMQVISGRKAVNSRNNGAEYNGAEHNGSEYREDFVSSGNVVAVAEVRRTEEMPPEPAVAFTAEDLCGAPVIPVPKAAAKNEITADDVCWVPEEMRLKPQPPVVEQPASAKLHVMPSPEQVRESDIQRPGSVRESVVASSRQTDEEVITAADIWREPAPYMVVPMLNGMDSEPEPTEITAADIARDWVLNNLSEQSGPDMPTSFRVLKSVAPAVSTADAAGPAAVATALAAEMAAPVIEASAPTIEAAAPMIEAAAAPVIEAAAVPASEMAAPVVESVAEASTQVAEEVAASTEPVMVEAPAHVDGLVGTDPEIITHGSEAPVEMPVPAVGVEAETFPEQDEADTQEIEAALAHPGDLSAQEIPAELEPEAALEQDAEAEAKASANVFAREGFWGAAAESEAGEGEIPSKAMLRGMKRAYTASGSADFEKHPEGWFSAWKTMLRLGSVLPWVARALPALESGALGVEPGPAVAPGAPGATGVAQETRQDVAGLRLVQYEIRTTVQDHSMQLKRMEEQLTRVRESVESRSSENAEVAENLRATTRLMKLGGMGLGALLLVLIVLVIVMLAHH